MTSAIAQLADVRNARVHLDERELELIDRARHAGATWAEIAVALGLGSRQAAEQRRQRLAAARRSRRQALDRRYSARIAALRAAVTDLQRWIDADRGWDARFPAASLMRGTAAHASDSAPGALYALARHLVADLAEVEAGRLPLPVQAVVRRIEIAMSTKV